MISLLSVDNTSHETQTKPNQNPSLQFQIKQNVPLSQQAVDRTHSQTESAIHHTQ